MTRRWALIFCCIFLCVPLLSQAACVIADLPVRGNDKTKARRAWYCDTFGDAQRPTSGLRAGDVVYDIATTDFYLASDGTTLVKQAGGPAASPAFRAVTIAPASNGIVFNAKNAAAASQWLLDTSTTPSQSRFPGRLMADNTAGYFDFTAYSAHQLVRINLAPAAETSTLYVHAQGIGNSTTYIGNTAITAGATDDPTVATGTRGSLTALRAYIGTKIDHTLGGIDDANAINIVNVGTGKATEALYFGRNCCVTGSAWFTLITFNDDTDIGLNFGGGTYLNYGIDMRGTGDTPVYSGALIRFPNNKYVVGRNAADGADVNLFKFNASNVFEIAAASQLDALQTMTMSGAGTGVYTTYTNSTNSRSALIGLADAFNTTIDTTGGGGTLLKVSGTTIVNVTAAGPVVTGVTDTSTGYRVNALAPKWNVLQGNGTNFVSAKPCLTTRPNESKVNDAADKDFTSIYTIAAGDLVAQNWLQVNLDLEVTPGGTPTTMLVYLKLGTTKVFTQATAVTPTASVTRAFAVAANIVGTQSVSATATVDVSTVAPMANVANWNATAATVDTTGTLTVVPGITFGNTDGEDTVKLRNAQICWRS